MSLKSAAYYHGQFAQRVRAASNNMDKLKALFEYEAFMDEVENDLLMASYGKGEQSESA